MVSSLSGELEVELAPRFGDRLPGENLLRGLRVLLVSSNHLVGCIDYYTAISNIQTFTNLLLSTLLTYNCPSMAAALRPYLGEGSAPATLQLPPLV